MSYLAKIEEDSETLKLEIPELSSDAVQKVADANTLFTANLHQVLPKSPNLIYSTFSLSTTIAMCTVGAKGATADEIMKVLKFPTNENDLEIGYSNALALFQKPELNDGYTLVTANKIYPQAGYQIESHFSSVLQNSFQTPMEQLDFSKSDESTRKINEWVANVTNNKIKDLFDPALDPHTILVLVNGVYFKGVWEYQFDSKLTRPGFFYVSKVNIVRVSMMYIEGGFPYAEIREMGCLALVLPYKGDRLVMLLLLPSSGSELSKVESEMKNWTPTSIFGRMESCYKVRITLPRFKIECTFELIKPLKMLGLEDMFDSNKANFSGMTLSPEGLCVSRVVQKAFIEVNEEGSEAAAATGVVMRLKSIGSSKPRIPEFNANHPFLFQIIDKWTNFILFSGAVHNPDEN